MPCHNPVRSSDDPVCISNIAPLQDANGNNILDKHNQPIYRARQADPRRSCVFWVDQWQAAGPLGYGPPLYDEITGETISGQAYIYGAALQTYAARSRDLMLLLNGDISEPDYVNGANVAAWVQSHPTGTGFVQGNQAMVSGATMTPSQLLTMSSSMNFDWAKGFTPANGYPPLDWSSTGKLWNSMASLETAIYNNYYVYGSNSRDTITASLIDTPLEAQMITPESLAVSGVSPMYSWNDLSVGQKVQVSPLRQAALSQQLNQMKMGAEIRGVDLYDQFEDNGLQQRLRYYAQQYGVKPGQSLAQYAEPMRQDMIHAIFTAVTLHEVGHNMGCRHNFRGSYDALNYQPGYWDIRTEAAANPDPGTPPNPSNNPLQLHPRYVNQAGGKLTQYELNHQVQEYQYTSIMDYGSEFNSDLQGLGLYDKALIKFSYAKYVEVFTDTKTDTATRLKVSSLSQFQSAYGFPSPLGTGVNLTAVAYQNYPQLFNSGKDGICSLQPPDATHADSWCANRMDVPFSSIQEIEVTDPSTDEANYYWGDPNENPLVPFYFCSDEYVGNMTCQRFDSGADAYEQATDIISRYNNFYLLNNFKRDRAKFYTSSGYKDRIAARYFDLLREQMTWYTLLRSDFQASLTAEAEVGAGNDPNTVIQLENAFFTDENGWGNFTAAVSAGFDLLGQTITTPSAGLYYKTTGNYESGQTSPASTTTPVWAAYGNDSTSQPDPFCFSASSSSGQCAINGHTIGLIDGKYATTTWDFTGCGYYWADECQTRIGYLIDKEIALDELSQSQAYFTGRDTSTDVRQYAIGYVVPFKAQLEDKIGAILSNDIQHLAPYFAASGTEVTAEGGTQTAYSVMQPSWTLDDPDMQKGDPTDPLQGIIDPATGFTLSLYAGVYALAAFPSTFDHDFIDNTQIFVVGNGEATVPDSYLENPCSSVPNSTCNPDVTTDPSALISHTATNPSASASWLVVTDPINGQTFAAHSIPVQTLTVLNSKDPSGHTTTTSNLRSDIGVRMLEQLKNYAELFNAANALADSDATKVSQVAFTQAQYLNFREQVEIMRGLQNAFGYGTFAPEPSQTY